MAHKPLKDRDYYLAEEVAERLGVHVQTVYEKVRRDEIPHISVGRWVRIPKRPFDIWYKQAYGVEPGATNPIVILEGNTMKELVNDY